MENFKHNLIIEVKAKAPIPEEEYLKQTPEFIENFIQEVKEGVKEMFLDNLERQSEIDVQVRIEEDE